MKIPILSGKTKNIAFIIDFGGGTFDATIIESTQDGDISKKGKHSKPLGADSESIGGFFINQKIGEYLIKRNLKEGSKRKKADQFIKISYRVKKGEIELSTLSDEKQEFIKNLRRLIQSIEAKKIELCRKITNWKLEEECYERIAIDLPSDPFSENTKWYSTDFFGHELAKIFKNEIWDKHIKKIITKVLSIAKEKLVEKEITVTLISGGSSNIRWLEEYIALEFDDDLAHAKPTPLFGSFQEIVAKGLAIECARRKYEPNSEFVSVTYNPVRLLLNPDDRGIEIKDFKSIQNKIDMQAAKPGDLIPSAQALKNFKNEPLQWKVKLDHPPKNSLNYYFLRPSDEPTDEQPDNTQNLYNISDHTVYTSNNSKFDSQIRVEITIRDDNTAVPKFIYKVGNENSGGNENSEQGTPFVLDMTSDSKIKDAGDINRYIGFDFGTSNSSICYLTNEQLSIIETRSSDNSSMELKDLIPKLPYPVSLPLRNYIGQYSEDKIVNNARDAFEALLAFAAFISASELLAIGGFGKVQEKLKPFQRSAGQLKGLLAACLRELDKDAEFSSHFNFLFSKYPKELKEAVDQFTQHKHNTLSAQKVAHQQHLTLLSRICFKAMENKTFGYFRHMEPAKYNTNAFTGKFVKAFDNQLFIDIYDYQGKDSFDISIPILIDTKSNKSLSLFPFFFWDESDNQAQCYVLDQCKKEPYSYKLIDKESQLEWGEEHQGIKESLEEIISDKSFSTEFFSIELKQND